MKVSINVEFVSFFFIHEFGHIKGFVCFSLYFPYILNIFRNIFVNLEFGMESHFW